MVREPMKIAMMGHRHVPSREGGVEIVVHELSKRMADLGHAVVCYNRAGGEVTPSDLEKCPHVTYRTVPTIDRKGLAAVTSSFFAAVAASFSKADVVHIHAEGPAFMCWLPRLMGKRVVVTIHGLDWQREKWQGGFGEKYIHAGEKMAVRHAHEIIVLSSSAQDYFLETYGRQTVRIPNGVNVPQILPAQCITERFGLKKDEYILYLGRLVPEKGAHYLIEAFCQTKTHKKLVIAGGTADTDDYVRKLHAAAQGDDRIVFAGFVQGQLLAELYSNAYFYVLPSNVEGMPLSLMEAMSYGNCCLTSDIPECAEVVEDKGLTFEKGNVPHLTEKLQQLCDRPAMVDDYRETAQAHICGKYHWDDVCSRTLELYRKKD